MSQPPDDVVRVEILGQSYSIRSSLAVDYVHEIAAYVDDKMRAACDATPNSDVLRVAVLVALNLADELFRCRDGERRRTAEVSEKAAALEEMLDRALS